jgi:hypothetical protein
MYRKTPAKFGPVDETAIPPLTEAYKEKALPGRRAFLDRAAKDGQLVQSSWSLETI